MSSITKGLGAEVSGESLRARRIWTRSRRSATAASIQGGHAGLRVDLGLQLGVVERQLPNGLRVELGERAQVLVLPPQPRHLRRRVGARGARPGPLCRLLVLKLLFEP